LVQRLLQENPEKRPQDPVVLEAEMQRCLAKIERHATAGRSILVPPTSLVRAELIRPRVRWARALRSVFAGLAIIVMAATASAFLLPRIAAVWHRETTAKSIGIPIGVPQPEPTEIPPNVAERAVTPLPGPSAAPSSTAMSVGQAEQKPAVAEASQFGERSGLTKTSVAESIDSGYSRRKQTETVSTGSSARNSDSESPAMARHYGSNHESSRSSLAEQHAAAKAIPRALPVVQDEATQETSSSEVGHPQFIGRAPDGSPVLRFPSGEIATVARPVEPNSLRRHHYRTVRIEPRNSDNPPDGDSDSGD